MTQGETPGYHSIYLSDLAERLRKARRPLARAAAVADPEAIERELEILSEDDRQAVEQILREEK